MFGLPQTTEVRKQLPKKAIYQKFDLKPSQRESFDADISRLDIVAVVSQKTVPALSEGNEVREIYVIAVQLKRKEYDSKNITLLTKLIPQRMVFALQFDEQIQFAIYHTKLITSEWQYQSSKSSFLTLQGLNLDVVWENIVKSIGQIEVESGNTLTEQIATNDQREKLLAQIKLLERRMVTEKQPRKKRDLFEHIKKLKNQI